MTKQRAETSKLSRIGVNKVENAILGFGHIWREQAIEDIGVDAIIELCLGNYPTGKLVGVQVKAGNSYLKDTPGGEFTYSPNKTDIEYWEKLTLPLMIVFYHPGNNCCYWKDISNEINQQGNDLSAALKINVPHAQTLSGDFDNYIKKLFDLVVPTDDEFRLLTEELNNLKWVSPEFDLAISGTDIFMNGLWGLCTKVMFHLSLITDTLKRNLIKRKKPAVIRMRLDRHSLQNFIISYLRILKKHRLADFDTNDVNHTIYVKREWPTFIAPLTLSGRKYIDYLTKNAISEDGVHDRQFFNLIYLPHVFIEVFDHYYPEQEKLGRPCAVC